MVTLTAHSPRVVSSSPSGDKVFTYLSSLTSDEDPLQHLPTQVHPAVMGTWHLFAGGQIQLAIPHTVSSGPGGTSGAHTTV